jgi:hypothetical protein
MAAILDLVSVDYLTNACVDWSDFYWGDWRKVPVDDQCHRSLSPRFPKKWGDIVLPFAVCPLGGASVRK